MLLVNRIINDRAIKTIGWLITELNSINVFFGGFLLLYNQGKISFQSEDDNVEGRTHFLAVGLQKIGI